MQSYNPLQNDTDHDGSGDTCDSDDDNDLVCDSGSIISLLFGNVASSATFFSFSPFENLTPQLMIDNDTQTFFAFNNSGDSQFTMDLGSAVHFNELRIDYADAESFAHNISIEISQDNVTYLTLFNLTNNTPLNMGDEPFNTISIENTYPVQYVRVVIYDVAVDENATQILNQTTGNLTNASTTNMTNASVIYATTKITEISVSSANVTCRAGPNGYDNCHYTANPDQSDNDNDTIGNACDNCINDFNPDQKDDDDDGRGIACDVNIFYRAFAYDPVLENVTFPTALLAQQDTGYFVIQ